MRLTVLGAPPYFVQVERLTITDPDFAVLAAAVEREDIAAIHAYVTKYGNVNSRELPSRQTALGLAAAGGRDESLKALLQLGAEVNSPDYIGVTPLMNAVQAGDITAARLLIAAGANTAAVNKAGASALSLALARNRADIADLLRIAAVHPMSSTR